MNTENLNKIYSQHGIRKFFKTVDVLNDVEDILLDVFNQDKSSQEMFFYSMDELIKTYKTKVTL